MLYAAIAEIAQKRISCSQRQKTQRRALIGPRLREKSIDNFIGSSISADGNKFSLAAPIRFASNSRRIASALCLSHFNQDSARSQPLQRGTQQFPAAPAARGRIHNG